MQLPQSVETVEAVRTGSRTTVRNHLKDLRLTLLKAIEETALLVEQTKRSKIPLRKTIGYLYSALGQVGLAEVEMRKRKQEEHTVKPVAQGTGKVPDVKSILGEKNEKA